MKNEPKEPELDWLKEPGRTTTFQAWLDSLNQRNIKRIRVELPTKLTRNWSTASR